MLPDLRHLVVFLLALGTPARALAQCSLTQGEEQVLGWGTAARVALDPTTEEPVVAWYDPAQGFVYRHFYGPEWGLTVSIDTAGLAPAVAVDGTMVQSLDLVLDDLGRPRLAFYDGVGLYHTRYDDGWTPPETLLALDLPAVDFASTSIRLERDADDRAHVIWWTSAWGGGGRRSYHTFDDGSGFGAAVQFDSGGWTPRAVADAGGNLHVVSFDSFPDPENPNGLHQFQAIYWLWTPTGGWPGDPEIITDEPNPPTGNGAGPLGFWPTVALDTAGHPHVAYPMHDTEDAADGRMHIVHHDGGGWSGPTDLFPCNGHGGKPVLAIDHRDTTVVMGLVYSKYLAADLGSGFGGAELWHASGAHWQFHDLAQTRGLFWHVFVPVDWKDNSPGDITLATLTKVGECPGIAPGDLDDDGVDDSIDLCPGFPDPAQWDTDGDGTGDGCDLDDDDDGVLDHEDVCPRVWDPDQLDSDGDNLGDACTELTGDDDDVGDDDAGDDDASDDDGGGDDDGDGDGPGGADDGGDCSCSASGRTDVDAAALLLGMIVLLTRRESNKNAGR